MAHRFDPTILREYDIRGPVGPKLGAADAHALGRSFATSVRRAGGRRVAVGYDGRLTSPALEAALVEGLCASGVDVVRTGLGPTPMLYYAAASDADSDSSTAESEDDEDVQWAKHVMDLRRLLKVLPLGRQAEPGWRKVDSTVR